MKRQFIHFLIGVSTLAFFSAQAQFDKGDKILDLGIGANTPYVGGIPLHAAFEVGINDVLSVGASLDFFGGRYTYFGDNYGFVAIYPAARVSYHFNKVFKLRIEELDIYGGGSLGFRTFAWSDTPPNTANYGSVYGTSVIGTAHVGGRWYFTPGFGVFAEAAAGIGGASNARGGIVLRF
jgi:hypothetical protein